MAKYYPVSPQFWTDQKVRAWDDHAKTLALYLLTCPHRNLEGLYRLPVEYIQADLQWKASRVEKAMERLVADEFVMHDADSGVVLLPSALKYHQPRSAKQLDGAVNALAEVPATPLRTHFMRVAELHSEPLFKRLTEGVSDEN